jgi:hypothetical protein
MRQPADAVQDCAIHLAKNAVSSHDLNSLFLPDLIRVSSTETEDDQPGIDGLKFRLVSEGVLHYFREVRFKGRLVNPVEKQAVVRYFEGRCLEKIRREDMARQFKGSTYLASLLHLVGELQRILCD